MTVSTSRGKALLDQHELESKELASLAMEIAARQLLHGMKKKILEVPPHHARKSWSLKLTAV